VAILEEQNEAFPAPSIARTGPILVEGWAPRVSPATWAEISSEEIARLDPAIYQAGRVIGKAGIENSMIETCGESRERSIIEVAASGQLVDRWRIIRRTR